MTLVPRPTRARQSQRAPSRSSARSASGVTTALTLLGARVRALRAGRALTQEQAAARGKLDQAHWRAIEAGHTNPTVATLVGIARALKVDITDLFTDEELTTPRE